jgi:trk system potassium uptake protein TrkH
MIIGGGMGSTAGAIKQYRIIVDRQRNLLGLSSTALTPSRMMYPHLITRAGETKEVEVGEYKDASLYALFYLGVLAAGSLALSFFPGYNFQEGIYEFASGLSGTGNSIVDFYAYKASYSLA